MELTIIEKTNLPGEPVKHGEVLKISPEKLIGTSTNSLYVRTGFLNGTLFLSQRGNGETGSGDICKLTDVEIEVNAQLFSRIKIFAEKAGAIVSTQ